MKDTFTKIGFILVAAAAIVVGLLLGRYLLPYKPPETPQISTQSILQSVASQGFLITQTVIAEQKVNYKVDKGSDWSNFWWGHEITARATMQSSVGIDLAPMRSTDIVINDTTKTVCFKYGVPTVQSTALLGDIEVSTQSGVLKKLFANDPNNDYNISLGLLKTEAQKSALTVPNLTTESYKSADRTLGFLFSKSGYTISAECRN